MRKEEYPELAHRHSHILYIYTMLSPSCQCILVRLIRLYEYVAAVFCFRPCARRSCQCSLSQASSYHPAQLQSNLILHSVHPLREHCVLQPFYDNKLELWWWVSPRLLWSYNPDVLVVLLANCQANPDFQPVASGGDGDSTQYCSI